MEILMWGPPDLLMRPETQEHRSRLSGADPARRVVATCRLASRPWRCRPSGAADAAAGLDMVGAVALPLPTAAICRHHLGVPAADAASYRLRGHDVARTLEPLNDQFHAQLRARSGQWLTDPTVRTEAAIQVEVLLLSFPVVSPTQGR